MNARQSFLVDSAVNWSLSQQDWSLPQQDLSVHALTSNCVAGSSSCYLCRICTWVGIASHLACSVFLAPSTLLWHKRHSGGGVIISPGQEESGPLKSALLDSYR